MSSQCAINTGAPQGCVLCSVLFILYTNSFTACQRDCHVFKYADDTAVLGKITNSDESCYRQEVTHVVDWCTEHHLVLNTGKTKELIIDLRSRSLCHYPVFIHNTPVSIVSTYKYLGTIIDDKLQWNENVRALCSKGNKRLYFIRKLKSFHIDSTILKMFYSSVVQSVITLSCICWWNNLSKINQGKLEKVRRGAKRIIGSELTLLSDVYKTRLLKKTGSILSEGHPLSQEFSLLRSGRRLQAIKFRTNRFRDSFVPTAVRLFNENKYLFI